MKNILENTKIYFWVLLILIFMIIHFPFAVSNISAADINYPLRPVQVIIGFQPGDTDNLCRPFIEKMPEFLGQPMTFVYKPGAAGSIGASFVASAKPDGYTLLGTSQSSICVVPVTQPNVGYSWKSFSPVSCLLKVPYIFAVHANSRWKDINELVAEAKSNPKKISYSSSGTYGLPHIAAEIFCKEAGINLNYIPSQGSTPAVTAVLGRHVDAVSTPTTPALGHIRSGSMRALAVFGDERIKALPDVPTLKELGYSVVVSVVVGLLAPKETPAEIINMIHEAANKAVQKYEAFITERLTKLGAEIYLLSPGDYSSLLKKNDELFKKIIKDLKN